jgi:hypothetical protein
MNRAYFWLALCLACIQTASAPAAQASCRAPSSLTLRVRFAGEVPRIALLEPTSGGLRLRDATTGIELWSADSRSGATQQITSLDATIGTSLTAVDLDNDGLHDRIYAGDSAGRLWRFDLRSGARPASWMQTTLFANLGVTGGGRGFVAAPDVARIKTSTGTSWLSIAIGTANTGTARADHRFYLLRDSLTGAPPATPLSEADLEQAAATLRLTSSNARGYYQPLGAAQVLAPSLTLDGRVFFTAVESSDAVLAGCASGLPQPTVPLSVTVLRATDGAVDSDSNGDGRIDARDLRRILSRTLPANTGVELASTPAGSDGRLLCHIGAQPLPDCFLDTRPRRTWWRRDDAE